MNEEPDPLDAMIDCPDCEGEGEIEFLIAAGPFGYDGQTVARETCPACGGSGHCRLGDLEKAKAA